MARGLGSSSRMLILCPTMSVNGNSRCPSTISTHVLHSLQCFDRNMRYIWFVRHELTTTRLFAQSVALPPTQPSSPFDIFTLESFLHPKQSTPIREPLVTRRWVEVWVELIWKPRSWWYIWLRSHLFVFFLISYVFCPFASIDFVY